MATKASGVRVSFFLVTLAIALGGRDLAGAEVRTPNEVLCEIALLPALPWSKTKIFDSDIRGEPGGIYVPPNEPIPDLPRGRYIYNILRDGGCYLLAELDVARWIQEGRGVHKHELFGYDHQVRFGRPIDPDLVISGWLVKSFGELTFLSNGSGSRMGGPELTEVARRFFDLRGLKSTRATSFETLGGAAEVASRAITLASDAKKNVTSQRGLGHTDEAEQFDIYSLRLLADVYTHPDGLKLMALYDELVITLKAYVRDGVSARVMPLLQDLFNEEETKRKLDAFFLQPIEWAKNIDGMHFGIYRLFDSITRHDFRPTDYVNRLGPVIVQRAIDKLDARLTPDDRARLERVRDGFAALPDWTPPHTGPAKTLVTDELLYPLEGLFPPIDGPMARR